MKAILYTIDGCVHCYEAKQHLIKNDISFMEKNLFTDKNAAIEIKELLGEIITPVFVDGDSIIKGNDICKIVKKGEANE